MNFGTVFYLVAQVPAQYCGMVLLLVMLGGVIYSAQFPSRDSEFAAWFCRLDYTRALIILTSVVALALAQASLLPYALSAFTVVHLALYLVLFGAQRPQASAEPLIGAILLITALNALALLGSVLEPVRNLMFIEKVGGLRFQAFYAEPSVAAFTYVFNVHVLWQRRHERYAGLFLGLNLLFLLLTFSGSGLMLLGLLLLVQLRRMTSTMVVFRAFGLLVLGLVTLRLALPEAFEQMFVVRLTGIATSQIDNSTFLRFVAPWLFINDLANNQNYLWTGTGIGGLIPYIQRFEGRLWFLVNYDGESLYALNNGYALVISLLGLPLALLLLGLTLYKVFKAKSDSSVKALFLAYPFFSGYLIHPLVWLLLAGVVWPTRQATGAKPDDTPPLAPPRPTDPELPAADLSNVQT